MFRAVYTGNKNSNEKRYSVATVSQAIGRSEGSISGYFSNKGIPTKGGITLDQIIEIIEAPARGKIINSDDIREIHDRLRQRGYDIEEY